MNTATASALRPSYYVNAREIGYAVNDGRYLAQRVAPTYWSAWGTLQRVGESRVLGVFDTEPEARQAAAADLAVWETLAHTHQAVR